MGICELVCAHKEVGQIGEYLRTGTICSLYCFTKQRSMPRPQSAIANNITVVPVSGINTEVNSVTEVMRPFENLPPGPVCGNVNGHELASLMK